MQGRDTDNLGALPIVEIEDRDTDPHLFEDCDTKQRCLGCGTELDYDDSAFYAGQVDAYNRVYDWLLSKGIHPVSAARMLEAARIANRNT